MTGARKWFIFVAVLACGWSQFSFQCFAAEKVSAQTIGKYLDYIRSLDNADPKDNKTINARMDRIWNEFKKDTATSLPILRETLDKESKQTKPAQYLLLDLSAFLTANDLKNSYNRVLEALKRINPKTDIIRYNFEQLFRVFRVFAQKEEKQLLPLIPEIFFIGNENKIHIVQHSLQLNAVLASAFLYGPYGKEGEKALLEFVKKNDYPRLELLELLHWISVDKSIELVKSIFNSRNDYHTYARCLSFFMSNGGEEGKRFLLTANIDKYDQKTKDYFKEVKPRVEQSSLEQYRKLFARLPGKKKVSDAELKKILKGMVDKYSVNRDFNPEIFLSSNLTNQYLIDRLVEVRSRIFHRLSDEALSEVKGINAIINALLYRSKQ